MGTLDLEPGLERLLRDFLGFFFNDSGFFEWWEGLTKVSEMNFCQKMGRFELGGVTIC